MEYTTLDEQGFAVADGYIKCYVTNSNREYIGQRDEFVSVGTGLSAGSYIDAPPAPQEGMSIIRGVAEWEYIEDHRGETVYNVSTGEELVIETLGTIPDGYTSVIPEKPKSELYNFELAALGASFAYDINLLSASFAKAALADGVNEQTKKLAIYNEYQSRKFKNISDIAALKVKYGV